MHSADRERLNLAIGEITTSIIKTLNQFRPSLERNFGLEPHDVSIAAAHAGTMVAAFEIVRVCKLEGDEFAAEMSGLSTALDEVIQDWLSKRTKGN